MNERAGQGEGQRADARRAPVFPLREIAAPLAFGSVVPELERALKGEGSVAVVQAPPGSGKTTVVPPLVANLVRGAGRVVVTQPRRVAARAAAARLRALTKAHDPELAKRVAYTVRGDSTRTRDTLVEFVTPGILLRRLIADPELTGTAAVIVDEAHERSLDSDLVLAMLRDLHDLRDDLRIAALSATLDASKFAQFLGDPGAPAPVIDSPTALHPVRTEWAPFAGPRTSERGCTREFLSHVAAQAVSALTRPLPPVPPHAGPDPSPGAPEPGGTPDHAGAQSLSSAQAPLESDVLVFVPGAWDVETTAAEVRERARNAGMSVEVCELHGRIDSREQDRIVSGRGDGEPRRVIVSTNLAESSLTVPGVRIVVDAGLSREIRRDQSRSMSGLVTVTASRASMAQRAGRAGRLGPGLAIACIDSTTYRGAPEHPQPEIASADLTEAALVLAAWGAPGGEGMRFVDPLPAAALGSALETLEALGATGADGRLTAAGATFARIPADPRLARALLDGAALVGEETTASVVAALSLGAPLPTGERGASSMPPNLASRLNAEEKRFARLARESAASAASSRLAALASLPAPASRAHAAGVVVALAYPPRIARRVREGVYELAGGSRASLPQGGAGEWIAVAEVQRSTARDARETGALIRDWAPLTEAEARAAAGSLVRSGTTVSFASGSLKARATQTLGKITLSSTPTTASPEAAREAISEALAEQGLSAFTWSEKATNLRNRLALLHATLGDPWPAVDDASLAHAFENLAPDVLDALAGIRRPSPLPPAHVRMEDLLTRMLPWPEAARLDELAPERIEVPSGSRIALTYPEIDAADTRVRLSVKLQEMFGLTETPTIAEGRVTVLMELLSPARRPLALTDDLASFWAGPYQSVRAEMRGTYPKHPWPEDPRGAVATAKTNRALARERGAKSD